MQGSGSEQGMLNGLQPHDFMEQDMIDALQVREVRWARTWISETMRDENEVSWFGE